MTLYVEHYRSSDGGRVLCKSLLQSRKTRLVMSGLSTPGRREICMARTNANHLANVDFPRRFSHILASLKYRRDCAVIVFESPAFREALSHTKLPFIDGILKRDILELNLCISNDTEINYDVKKRGILFSFHVLRHYFAIFTGGGRGRGERRLSSTPISSGSDSSDFCARFESVYIFTARNNGNRNKTGPRTRIFDLRILGGAKNKSQYAEQSAPFTRSCVISRFLNRISSCRHRSQSLYVTRERLRDKEKLR